MSCQAHRGFMPLTDCIYCLWAELEALRGALRRIRDWEMPEDADPGDRAEIRIARAIAGAALNAAKGK